MATYTLTTLSGSTNGKGVKIAATSSTGTTVHTNAAGIDLLTLWAVNNNASGVSRTLTIEWGTTTAADGNIKVSIPAQAGAVYVCDRLPIKGTLLVTAFADVANEVLVFGTATNVA